MGERQDIFYDDLISTASCRLRRRCVKKIALLFDQISSFGSYGYLVSLDNKQKLQKLTNLIQKLTNLIRRKSVKIKKVYYCTKREKEIDF